MFESLVSNASSVLSRSSLTLADVTEPNVGQRASTLAVDSLELVLADDDVGDAGAVLQNEDGAVATGVSVGIALPATVELLVSIVLGARDDAGLGKRNDASRAGGDVEGLGRGETSHGGGQSSVDELHCGNRRQDSGLAGLLIWI